MFESALFESVARIEFSIWWLRKKDAKKIEFIHNKSLFQHRRNFGIDLKHRPWVDKIVLLSECALKFFGNYHGGFNMAAKSMKYRIYSNFCNNSTIVELPKILYDSK